MKIEMNTIYHLPTQAHEDDFLKQAEKRNLRWGGDAKATKNKHWSTYKEEHCILVGNGRLSGWDCKSYFKGRYSNPIIEWKIGFTKADMQIGQTYLQVNGLTHRWSESDNLNYLEDLTFKTNNHDYDVVEVYGITPIWKRPEPKYRVKTELTKEQAEKLGLEFCEEVTE